jgi:hypothetical protein
MPPVYAAEVPGATKMARPTLENVKRTMRFEENFAEIVLKIPKKSSLRVEVFAKKSSI